MAKPTIPGPKGRLLLGSFREFQSDPLNFLLGCQASYGDVVRFRMGPIPVYAIFNPANVHQILVEDADKFHKASPTKQTVKRLLGNGLVVSEDSFWKQQRKMMQPAFHHKRTAAYAVNSRI